MAGRRRLCGTDGDDTLCGDGNDDVRKDKISCGFHVDTVIADKRDKVDKDCEKVV